MSTGLICVIVILFLGSIAVFSFFNDPDQKNFDPETSAKEEV